MTAKKQKKKKKKATKKKKRDLYFNEDTQAAIVEYQQSDDDIEKERVFVARIHPAFDKLVENLIHIHRFSGQYDTHEDLKSDCVAFLYESIHKFDPSRGTNAFSYFNIVAKHWLIIRSKKRMQRQKRNVSMDASEELSAFDSSIIEQSSVVPAQDELIEDRQHSESVLDLLREIRDNKAKNENEWKCVDAILTVFNEAQSLDLLTKSAVLTYIREISGLTPKQLTQTMYVIKRHYRELRADDLFDLFDA